MSTRRELGPIVLISSTCFRSTQPNSRPRTPFVLQRKSAHSRSCCPPSTTNNTIWAIGRAMRLAKGLLCKVMVLSPQGILSSPPCHLIQFNELIPSLGRCLLRQPTPQKKKPESSLFPQVSTSKVANPDPIVIILEKAPLPLANVP